MSDTVYAKESATDPALSLQLTVGSSPFTIPIGATVVLRIKRDGADVIERPCTVTSAGEGIIAVEWDGTEAPGQYLGEVHLTKADGKKRIFPEKSYIPVSVIKKL